MRRILRGLIQAANEPDRDDALANWRAFEAAGLDYPVVEDKHIVQYLTMFYQHHDAPPPIELIKEYFEKKDDIEVVSRLAEIAKAVPYKRTNYAAIIQAELEQQAIKSTVLLLRDAALIAEHGIVRDKGVLRGPAHAVAYLDKELQKLRLGKDEWEFVNALDMSKPLEPVKMLLPHFRIGEGRPSCLVGYAGSSKTFLAIELALACATGQTCWGGLPLAIHGPVVHLDYEMGRKSLTRRYQRVAKGMNVDLANLLAQPAAETTGGKIEAAFAKIQPGYQDPAKRLQVACFPNTNLTSPSAVHKLTALCKGKALLIIDSFRAATVGAKTSENDSEMRVYFDRLAQVSDRTGCVILVLHHQRKQPKDGGANAGSPLEQMRGSSGLADALGATIHISKLKNGAFRLTQGKTTLGQNGESLVLKLEDVGDQNEGWFDTEGIKVVEAEDEIAVDESGQPSIEDKYQTAVRAAIATGGVHSVTELYEACRPFGVTNKERIFKTLHALGARKDDETGVYRLPTVEDIYQ